MESIEIGIIWIILLVIAFFILSRFVRRLETKAYMPFINAALSVTAIVVAVVYRKWIFLILALFGIEAMARTARKSGLLKKIRAKGNSAENEVE